METFSATTPILILAILVVLFFALREVNCWYWKINRRLELQEETNSLLQKLLDQTQKKEVKSSKAIDLTEITDVNDPKVMEALMNKLGKKE